MRAFNRRVTLTTVAVVGLALVGGAYAGGKLRTSTRELSDAAKRLEEGDFSSRVYADTVPECAQVATAFNAMAASIQQQFEELKREQMEHEAILSSIVEGVIAVDTDDNIIAMNEAAGRMLGVEAENAGGRSIQELVRNASLQDLMASAANAEKPVEADIAFHGERDRFLQVHGGQLRLQDGKTFGVVVVMNDVTRLRLLENLRRDFAANVSHEVKTPITSIKGFVETLLDGAMHCPDDARRFLSIILQQTDRLSAIIEDLLLLSRIEKEQESGTVQLSRNRLKSRLESVVATCMTEAVEKGIKLAVDCPEELAALLNPVLFEQAVMNLVKNAVTYSNADSEVRLSARETERGEIAVHVMDSGQGIGEEHLERLFERFYRVDKARSRADGGTGLGLAIVKHVVNAHGGRVTVQSKLGEGSTFSIYLPTHPPLGSAR